LRKQDGHAGQVLVFIHTSPFRAQDKQYSRSITVPLRRPTCDTALIAGAAISGLRQIYKPGYRLAKAGVMLLDLQDSSAEQSELDLDDPGPEHGKLMGMLDALNTRYGRRSIQLASAGVGGSDRTWTMKQELKTPNYTTCWKDLPRARA
jgi:DNA polymerase V